MQTTDYLKKIVMKLLKYFNNLSLSLLSSLLLLLKIAVKTTTCFPRNLT